MSAAENGQFEAACLGVDPDLFFPGLGEDAEPAKKICAECPIRERCLDDAIERGEKYGSGAGSPSVNGDASAGSDCRNAPRWDDGPVPGVRAPVRAPLEQPQGVLRRVLAGRTEGTSTTMGDDPWLTTGAVGAATTYSCPASAVTVSRSAPTRCVESLERTLDIPSISPLIPGFPQANGTVLSAPMPYNGGTGDDCESSRPLAHSPRSERTTR